MGFLRKVGKKIKRAFKKIGKKIKRAFGKVAKFFGKLGPLGSIALSFLLPGIGSAISGWFSGLPAGNFIKVIGEKMIDLHKKCLFLWSNCQVTQCVRS